MKVTYNWLKDFVDIKLPPRQLADRLTMAGLEVKGIEQRQGDFIFDIEITSNRPDLLSVIGIAREVAAITNKKIKLSCVLRNAHCVKNAKRKAQSARPIEIKIEDKKDCPLYTARVIRGVKVGPSPEWLRKRLELVGCRSVNNVVDITNYVLFELGEPLHAFDLDALAAGPIIVRRAKPGEKITTIDGAERKLDGETLLIADNDKPVALAGIMGGKDTEVTEKTKSVLLEAAIFSPVVIRRARQSLGMTSEAAYRFERGVDHETVEQASLRATALIIGCCGGGCAHAQRAGLGQPRNAKIILNPKETSGFLGVSIPPVKMKSILTSLGFAVKARSRGILSVTVPARRLDVSMPMDIAEEVARIYGYEKIPTTLPAMNVEAVSWETKDTVSLIKSFLVSLGLYEVITYALVSEDSLQGYKGLVGSGVAIANPLSNEQAVLRTTLIPGLAQCIAFNLNQQQEYINIFEIGNIFSPGPQGPNERLSLGIALCGTRSVLSGAGLIREEAGFLHLKGAIEALFQRLGVRDFAFVPQATGIFAIKLGEEDVGTIEQLCGAALEKSNIKHKAVFMAELCLDKLLPAANLSKEFSRLPRFPGIARDISIVISEEVSAQTVLAAIKENAGVLLKEVRIADYYQGKQIPPGFRSLTVSCLFRSEERTLTEEEINPIISRLAQILEKNFAAKLR